jgi:hypothetical protein
MKIYQSSSQNHKNEPRTAPTVKNNAKQQDDNVFQFFRHQIIGENECGEEKEDKKDTAKNHKKINDNLI